MEQLPTQNDSLESLVAAALQFGGEIFSGIHHVEAFDKLTEKYPTLEDAELENVSEGFITNTGRFVDRKEAHMIALKAKQLKTTPLSSLSGTEEEPRLDSHNIDL